MIVMVVPLHAGNAMRLILRPPAGAVRWKVLRGAGATFTGHDDPSALLVYDGDEDVIVDSQFLQNDIQQFWRAFYTQDGVTWQDSNVASGTPSATYQDHTTDVLSLMRERLEAGLLVECQRANFATELGFIQVFNAPPTLDQNIRFPLVTIHLDYEGSDERAIGEAISGDTFDSIGFDWDESEGWLANVRLQIVGWSLNSDERIELRKAIRRIIVANLPVFDSYGWMLPNVQQQDIDAINGEYPAQIYQVMTTFTCVAPVRVSGTVDAIRDISVRRIDE